MCIYMIFRLNLLVSERCAINVIFENILKVGTYVPWVFLASGSRVNATEPIHDNSTLQWRHMTDMESNGDQRIPFTKGQ